MATLPEQKPDPRITGQMVLVNWLKHRRGLTDDQISVILGLKSKSSIAVLRRFDVLRAGQTTWDKSFIRSEFFLWNWQDEVRDYLLKRQSQPGADTAQIDSLIQIISEPSSRVTPEEAAEWATEINEARRTREHLGQSTDKVSKVERSKRTPSETQGKAPEMIQNPDKNQRVDTSQVKIIGSGNQFVYLYYFPIYRLYAKLTRSADWPYNIGRTIGDVKYKISQQIGEQLPEKPEIALIIKTDDCDSLETEIHDELKRRGKWLDPASENVLGVEWFLTNSAEIEGIVKSIDEKRKKVEKLEQAKQLLNTLGINDPSEAQLDTMLEMLHSTKNFS